MKLFLILAITLSSSAFANTVEKYSGNAKFNNQDYSCVLRVHKNDKEVVTYVDGSSIGRMGTTTLGSIVSGSNDYESKSSFSSKNDEEFTYKKSNLIFSQGYKFTARNLGLLSSLDEVVVYTENDIPTKVETRSNFRALLIKAMNGEGTCENLKLDSIEDEK